LNYKWYIWLSYLWAIPSIFITSFQVLFRKREPGVDKISLLFATGGYQILTIISLLLSVISCLVIYDIFVKEDSNILIVYIFTFLRNVIPYLMGVFMAQRVVRFKEKHNIKFD